MVLLIANYRKIDLIRFISNVVDRDETNTCFLIACAECAFPVSPFTFIIMKQKCLKLMTVCVKRALFTAKAGKCDWSKTKCNKIWIIVCSDCSDAKRKNKAKFITILPVALNGKKSVFCINRQLFAVKFKADILKYGWISGVGIGASLKRNHFLFVAESLLHIG